MEEGNKKTLSDKELTIGDVFTPLRWALFAIEQMEIFEKWMQGASVFDPTMGEGNLLEALVVKGMQRGYAIHDLPADRLFGNELNTRYYRQALTKFQDIYGLDMRSNFSNEDILRLKSRPFDIVFGNPPWKNFVDLPETYRESLKVYFHMYELAGDTRQLLLGGSRVDIAALIIRVAIKNFLRPGGEAIVFIPLSLLLNDGASRSFRTYRVEDINYAPKRVFDFNDELVFEGVATRYGLVHFVRDEEAVFPIPYLRSERGRWLNFSARPAFRTTDPLTVLAPDEQPDWHQLKPIRLPPSAQPRQGINTGGANALFMFDQLEQVDNQLVRVSNRTQQDVLLPAAYLYPLITSGNFGSAPAAAKRWILLPYDQTGKPLLWEKIVAAPALHNYLLSHEQALRSRRGAMLNAQLKRGFWWALLGIGSYNFSPYKVVWEAYGRTNFRPQIFEGHWQANQSLQAYIPLKTLAAATRVQAQLSDKRIEHYLRSMKMEGTMNWAQPGRIGQLIEYDSGVDA